jgi:hypothetical protein
MTVTSCNPATTREVAEDPGDLIFREKERRWKKERRRKDIIRKRECVNKRRMD